MKGSQLRVTDWREPTLIFSYEEDSEILTRLAALLFSKFGTRWFFCSVGFGFILNMSDQDSVRCPSRQLKNTLCNYNISILSSLLEIICSALKDCICLFMALSLRQP